MASQPAGISDEIWHAVNARLSQVAGAPVTLHSPTAISEGWSARQARYPWIVRCAVAGPPGWGERPVIVKTRRPDRHWRAGDTIGREAAALTLLQELGCDAGPRVLAYDEAVGFLVLEDLGTGPALEDLLVADDPAAATQGFIALATAVGRMHAATLGRANAFGARDRVRLANRTLTGWWRALRDVIAGLPDLPDTAAADADVAGILGWMTDDDGMLALSNGDLAPQNCRLGNGSARLLDFEDAQFQHVLLDAAHLRLPFYGGPCWSRIPAEVGRRVESAYRETVSRACPRILDDRVYSAGMAASTAAWAIVRLVRLPKLLAADDPHPMDFSRRGQMLDTLTTAVDAARTSGTLPALRGWFEDSIAALRHRWSHLPPAQPVYPAYRTA